MTVREQIAAAIDGVLGDDHEAAWNSAGWRQKTMLEAADAVIEALKKREAEML
jgi:hypothetical protein